MIDCPNGDVRDVLPDYVNDRLGVPMRAEVERHLASCAACRDEVTLLGDVRATMRRAPGVNVDVIAAAIPTYRAPVKQGWATGWRTAAAIAAVAIGGASLALLRDDAPADRDRRTLSIAQAPVPSVDSTAAATAPSGAQAPNGGVSTNPPPAPPPSGELALAGASIGDLSDGELSALVDDLESFDAVPSAEVEVMQAPSLDPQEES